MPQGTVRTWIRVGVVSGLIACFAYPLAVFAPLPRLLRTLVGLAFGPALGFASVGLYHFLRLHRESVAAQIATLSNLTAGALVTTMLSVQMAVAYPRADAFSSSAPGESTREIIHWVWYVILGLDIAWDVFIGLGTLFFGFAMLRHPRLGRLIGGIGILIAGVGVLGFNLYTLPTPPADAGLIDAGPLCGLWYLAVVILIWRSRTWVEEQLAKTDHPPG